MLEKYAVLAERALRDAPPTDADTRWILDGEDVELLPLLHAAFVPRRHHFGRKVMVHVLNNVQNGLCPEDCGYCAQNKDSAAAIRKYGMKSDDEIFAEAEHAARAGATRYCMVLSGRGPTVERTQKLAELIRGVKERWPIEVCLSVGLLDDEKAGILAEAGLDRLNHNLNTSESHYAEICSTHTWADRVATLVAAKKHGIEACSGLILGMGEGSADVIEVVAAGEVQDVAPIDVHARALRAREPAHAPVGAALPEAGQRLGSDGVDERDAIRCCVPGGRAHASGVLPTPRVVRATSGLSSGRAPPRRKPPAASPSNASRSYAGLPSTSKPASRIMR